MPDAGQIVGGRYRLIRPLGEGGMASVWAAEHVAMGNTVAVKIISPDLLQHDVVVARFHREARAAAKLRSPYVVQLFDHDVDPVVGPYIAMELLEGESLADRMDREPILPKADVSRIIWQVCKGLGKAHAAGIVHRDLKPENIFLTVDDDGEETAKILDFGVAKADSPLGMAGDRKTAAGTLLGTLNYMSPEQAQGREVNHLSDLWALGVIAFEALVGRRPFEDDAPGMVVMQICAHPIPVPSAINPAVPPGFDEWFAKACNRDPAQRFQTARELAETLAHVCDADELSAQDVVYATEPDDEESSIPIPPPVASQGPNHAAGRKKPVLQLVDSTAPPPPDPATASDPESLEVEVDFDLDPEYFIAHGGVLVGPVTMDTLRAGYQSGHVPTDALVWTAGWTSWRAALELFALVPERPRRRAAPNLTLVGPTTAAPPGAPPLPARRPVLPPPVPPARLSPPPNLPPPPVPLPSTPVTAVRTVTGKSPPKEPTYHLHDGAVTVGPVRASLLRRALEQSRVSLDVLVWRDGWDAWKTVAEMRGELDPWKPAAANLLRHRPGIEALGIRTRIPPKAPPLRAPGRKEHSS